MNEHEVRGGSTPPRDEALRTLLAENAEGVTPAPAPYETILRRGRVARRRRTTVLGTALAVLTAAPIGAYWLTAPAASADRAAPAAPTTTAEGAASARPMIPARPATERQLLDGITFEQAAEGLDTCLADRQRQEDRQDRQDRQESRTGETGETGGTGEEGARGFTRLALPPAGEFRILLAMRATGDSNSPGDGYFVVAVNDPVKTGEQVRVICGVKDSRFASLGVSRGAGEDLPDARPVAPDSNSLKLYSQSVIDKGNWKLPFRWGAIGTVEPSVAKVTVEYGGETEEAVLDDGWFVAAGELDRQVTLAPHVKGYDAAGKLVYDSDHDKDHERMLP
ncbi:hypothetical protein [Streptomyces sp. NPDC005012]|uniref:hypothetical protein n=1 Tax=Streptomyces sp. NPDC005012 TaxID=3154558 RepID=UPI0033BC9A1D